MLVYLLIGFTILFALLSISVLVRGVRLPLRYTWHRIFLSLSLAMLMYLYGVWVYVSIYGKYVFGIAYLLVLLVCLLRRKRHDGPMKGWRVAFNISLGIIFSTLCVLYFTGTTGKIEKAALAFPLKKGRYFVLQGGKGLPANMFHYGYRGAVYAIDIVKLNSFGNRANHIFSEKLEDYEIFGDTVFSPCNGTVINVRNENPDNIPPVRKRGPSNLNAVVIETDSFYVFLGHMKQGSAMVQEGDIVTTGQPLALVGNSGFSLEPHLHIQVHKKVAGRPWYSQPQLYVQFDGRTYLLFEVIRPRRVEMVDK